ncbi:MAG: hypothetical protein KBD94_11535 [Pyrinomonadaceae bacterium]|nr:hypothetical protein [Pyrinomonadaceae bacterium]
MKRIFVLTLVLSMLAATFACGSGDGRPAAGNDSPTEAYKRLYAACKSKDIEAIKRELSKKSIDLGVMVSQRNNTPIEKVYENGFTATTFAESLPTIRDERIKDDMGAVEVWNSKESKWEDLPFVLEDGYWKLAVGDLFAGSFKSPGKGLDLKEREAANAISGNSIPVANVNMNGVVPVNKAPAPPPAGNSGK